MKKIFKSAVPVFLVLFSLVFLGGCVNVNQKAKIAGDGSGSLTLHYWATMKNLKNKKELGGFSFEEDKINKKYSSSNNTVSEVKIEDKLDDSTRHVYVDIEFKDLNSLNSASGYEKITSSWKEGEKGMEFQYVIKQDTSAAKTMNASKYELVYEFEFPGEVLETNGRKDGNSVVWEKSLKDLKEDLVLTATIDSEGGGETSGDGKKCGLFGMELPLVVGLGMLVLMRKKFKKK